MSDEPLPIPEHSAEEVREKIAEILSRKEFRPSTKSIFERFSEWLNGLLDDFINPIMNPTGGPTWLRMLVMLALVILVVFVVVRLTRTMRSRAKASSESHASTLTRRTGREWRQEAEKHERAGAWRDALRCRYRALLVELVNRSVVGDVPGRTAGEYRIEAQHRLPLLKEPLKGATDLFEAAWYGNEPVGFDESQIFQELADQVVAVATTTSVSESNSNEGSEL